MTLKCCKKCGVSKPLDEFYRAQGTKDGHRGECKACAAIYRRQQYLANPEASKARVRDWQKANPERLQAWRKAYRSKPERKRADRQGHLKRKFGLTVEEYDEMVRRQGGVCYLCGKPPAAGQSLDVDHDHKTGAVRKLLCRNCNQGIGKFFEDPGLLLQTALYIIEERGEWHASELIPLITPSRERAAAR
jgi:hypothetical protein